MKKSGAILGAIVLLSFGTPQAHAVVIVTADYPMNEVKGGPKATDKGQLSQLVSLYENDVALMANSDKDYSKAISEAKSDPAVEAELQKLAGTLTLESLADAVATLVKATPENSLVIMASAVNLMANLEGGLSTENRVVLGKAALLAIPDGTEKSAFYAALIVGVAAKGQEQADITKTVITLRNFSLSDLPESKLVDGAGILDAALVKEGILTPIAATEAFVALAQTFNNTPAGEVPLGAIPADDVSTGDQGVTNTGPSTGGASGGSGGGGGNPTPTPTPTPAPTPVS